MKLNEQHINEFISLYEKRYGVILEHDVALEKGLKLCKLVELVVLESDVNEDVYEDSRT